MSQNELGLSHHINMNFIHTSSAAAGQIPANLVLDTPTTAVPVVGSTVTRQVLLKHVSLYRANVVVDLLDFGFHNFFYTK